MEESQSLVAFEVQLAEEHQRLLQEYENARKQKEKWEQKEKELAGLVDACARLLTSKGIMPAPGLLSGHENDSSQTLVGENVSQELKMPPVEERADCVVAFLKSIYPKGMHFLDIYQEMTDRGMPGRGKSPAHTLLACYSGDPRLERTTRGTYRAKALEV